MRLSVWHQIIKGFLTCSFSVFALLHLLVMKYKTRHFVLLLQWKRSCNCKNIRYFYHLRKIGINMFQGEELSSSELRSYLTIYLLRTGSDAVADIIKHLSDPIIVLSCIFLTSLHTWSRTFWKYLTIIKILKGWTSFFHCIHMKIFCHLFHQW